MGTHEPGYWLAARNRRAPSTMRDGALTVVEMEDRMLPGMMDDIGGGMIKRWCESKGVTVMIGTKITGIEAAGDGYKLALAGGASLDTDLVVCATGVDPYLDFLEDSGI